MLLCGSNRHVVSVPVASDTSAAWMACVVSGSIPERAGGGLGWVVVHLGMPVVNVLFYVSVQN